MVRTKFRCLKKTEEIQQVYNPELKETVLEKVYSYDFCAVYDGSPENRKFFSFTPAGTVRLSCTNNDTFEVGKEYYLDFTLA